MEKNNALAHVIVKGILAQENVKSVIDRLIKAIGRDDTFSFESYEELLKKVRITYFFKVICDRIKEDASYLETKLGKLDPQWKLVNVEDFVVDPRMERRYLVRFEDQHDKLLEDERILYNMADRTSKYSEQGYLSMYFPTHVIYEPELEWDKEIYCIHFSIDQQLKIHYAVTRKSNGGVSGYGDPQIKRIAIYKK